MEESGIGWVQFIQLNAKPANQQKRNVMMAIGFEVVGMSKEQSTMAHRTINQLAPKVPMTGIKPAKAVSRPA